MYSMMNAHQVQQLPSKSTPLTKFAHMMANVLLQGLEVKCVMQHTLYPGAKAVMYVHLILAG